MFSTQHLPQFAFLASVLLALALAYFTNDWPTALAMALAGLALGFSIRASQRPEPQIEQAIAVEELSDLRGAIDLQAADIIELREALDQLASVIESVAADSLGQRESSDIERLAGLERRIAELSSSVDTASPDIEARFEAIEERLNHLVRPAVPGARPGAADRVDAPRKPSHGFARLGRRKSAEQPTMASVLPARLGGGRAPKEAVSVVVHPVFTPDGRDPAAYIVEPPMGHEHGAHAAAMFGIAADLVSSNPEAQALLRFETVDLDHRDLSHPSIAGLSPDIAERISLLVPQAAISDGFADALSELLDFGVGLALERISDWSVDFKTLAQQGLRHVCVDGPAMARSAAAQKGDPKRLKAVLAARGIGLLTENIVSREDLAEVGALLPDLLTGPGLARARTLETA